jgi:hypothetical protein
MDRKYIDDHHIVARYLADQLSDAERTAFEDHYVRHPEMLRELDAAAALKIGLARLDAVGEFPRLLKPAPPSRMQKYLAAAAAIAIVAIGLLTFLVHGPSREPVLSASSHSVVDSLGAPLRIASTHSIERVRGVMYDATIDLPPLPAAIELRVRPEYAAEPPRYHVSLLLVGDNDAAREVAQLGGFEPNADGVVPVFLNSQMLKRGRYQLVLSGDKNTTAANDSSTFLIQLTSRQ